MKKQIILLVWMLSLTSIASAEIKVDKIYYNFNSDGTAEVAESTWNYEYKGDILIPETVTYQGKSYTVTSIGKDAFCGCKITSILIPNSVTQIGIRAFKSTDLNSVVIPNSVSQIYSSAFENCKQLTSVTIPKSVKYIGTNVFKDCSQLSEVHFNAISCEVGGQSNEIFKGCTNFSTIYFGENIQRIPSYFFSSCDYLMNVHISDLTSWCNIIFKDYPFRKAKYFFLNGKEIKDLVIPNSVDTIRQYAFAYCGGLTSVTIPNSVSSIGYAAFYGCSNLKSVAIPNSVTTIGKEAFMCSGLISIVIPNSVTSIESNAFELCSSLSRVVISNSVTTINESTFYGCNNLTSVTIPNSVTSIGSNAFNEYPTRKNQLEIILPDNITSVGNSAFSKSSKIYVNSGTLSALTIWSDNYVTYDLKTKEQLPAPSLSLFNATQTTMTLKLDSMYGGYTYKIIRSYSDTINATSNTVVFSGLLPERTYAYDLIVSKDLVKYYKKFSGFKTKDIKPSLKVKSRTASSITIDGDYIKGDADVMDYYFYYNKKEFKGPLKLTGLDPNTTPNVTYEIIVRESDNIYESYSDKNTTSIYALKFVTLQPKVISPGNVIVAAESNLDDEETNVGFEWRRTDWTDDFPSNTGQAFLYEGQLEGYIRNLNTEKLWKFRPYYESASGNRYYGEWMGLDPTNTSYFEPTVHTYAKVEVQGNTANVRGYAMRGSDNITSQGFMYWKQTAASRSEAPSIPSSAQTVTAKGNVMEASLTNLDYETTYCYVAFATTAEGETFYGDQRQFTTGEDVTIIEPSMATTEPAKPVAYYDLSGRHIDKPQQGLVIARMSDGTTRKMVVKK